MGVSNLYNLKVVIILVIFVVIAIPIGYFVTQLPKYDNAIVHGTLRNAFQGSDIRPGFARPDAWYLNISLDRGSHSNMTVWWDTPCQGQCYPYKGSDGLWYYQIIVNCNIYSPGDGLYLRVPLYQGGNIWSEPRAVQGYNYYNVSPHTYDYPALYKEGGIGNVGFVPITGC